MHQCLSISMKIAANIIGNHVSLTELWQGLGHQCCETTVGTAIFQARFAGSFLNFGESSLN